MTGGASTLALPRPTQGPSSQAASQSTQASPGENTRLRTTTAPMFACHRFPSSFLSTFSLAEREVLQAPPREVLGLRKHPGILAF